MISFLSRCKEALSGKRNRAVLFAAVTAAYGVISCLIVYALRSQLRIHATAAGFRPDDAWVLSLLCIGGFWLFYLLAAGLWVLLYRRHVPAEALAVLAGAVFGLLYLFILPPFGVTDEPMHYLKAYSVSQGRLVSQENRRAGCYVALRQSDAKMLMSFAVSANVESPRKYRDVYTILESRGRSGSAQTVPVHILPNMNSYSPLQYLPAALGLDLGKLLRCNPMVTFYLGRVFNLLCFLVLLYFTLKRLPFAKPLFFCIALLPMTLQLAASYSSDCILIALSLFYAACCLDLAFRKTAVTRKDLAVLLAASAALATFKMVYLPLCFLFLLVPAQKFGGGGKRALTYAALTALPVASWLSWMLFTSKYATMSNVMMSAATIKGNIAFLFHHTGNYLLMLCNTLAGKAEFYISSMVGSYLGWLDIPVNYVFVSGFLILLVLLAVSGYRGERQRFTGRQKLILFLISLCILGLVETSLFVTWTGAGSKLIQGVQGRYFIPILPLVLLLFRNRLFVARKNIEREVLLAACVLQFFSIVNVLGDILKFYS